MPGTADSSLNDYITRVLTRYQIYVLLHSKENQMINVLTALHVFMYSISNLEYYEY